MVVVEDRNEELSARSSPFSSVGIGKCNKECDPRVVFALDVAVSDRHGTRRTPFCEHLVAARYSHRLWRHKDRHAVIDRNASLMRAGLLFNLLLGSDRESVYPCSEQCRAWPHP